MVTSRDNDKLLNGNNSLEFVQGSCEASFTGTGAKQHCDENPRQWNCHTFCDQGFP